MLDAGNATLYLPSSQENRVTLTLLIDLDDTLLANSMDCFIPAYLKRLGDSLTDVLPADQLVDTLLAATEKMFANQRPDRTLEETFNAHFFGQLPVDAETLLPYINRFYQDVFPKLAELTHPKPQAVELVQHALQRNYPVGIATNPLFPRTAIMQRLAWADLDPDTYSFALIPSMETFHFAKPNPAYFAEFLGRLGWPEGPVLMVGNDLDHDVRGAREMGLAVFWIAEHDAAIPAGVPAPSARGCLDDVLPWVDTVDPEVLQPDYNSPSAITATLRGGAAALQGLARDFPRHLWDECPQPDEWCLSSIFCHLRDVEREVNLLRIQSITTQKNPFIHGVDTDAWAEERSYKNQDGAKALQDFLNTRLDTLALLDSLTPDGWERPARHTIFGPTTLIELAAIMAEHDRLHLRQVMETIQTIWETVQSQR